MGPAAAFLGLLQGKAASPRAFSSGYRPRWGLLILGPGAAGRGQRAGGRAAAVTFCAPLRPLGPRTARGAAALVPFPSRESIKGKAKLRLRECDVGDKFSHLPLRKASVLLPLLLRDGALCLLLTVRSMQLRRSPGEVCFPGGKREEMDKDEIDTALREAKEEVGLQPEKVEVICRLVPGIDKMNHLVTPVVGFIEDTFQASPNPDEVSDVFVVPLEYFIKPLNYVALPYKNSSGYLSWMHCFTYDDHEHKKSFKIWGLTAHFAVFLAIVIFRMKPTFEVHYDLDNLITSAENSFLNLYASINERKKSSL